MILVRVNSQYAKMQKLFQYGCSIYSRVRTEESEGGHAEGKNANIATTCGRLSKNKEQRSTNLSASHELHVVHNQRRNEGEEASAEKEEHEIRRLKIQIVQAVNLRHIEATINKKTGKITC